MSVPQELDAPAITLVEYENARICKECPTHSCCRIYASDEHGMGDKSTWLEEWARGFHDHPEEYGVERLFDPVEVHMRGHEAEWDALLARGIDPEWCQYYDSRSGCIVERDRRPTQCRQYNCGRLSETEDRIEIVLEVAGD